MKLIIDRITDGIAVCETEEQTFVKLPIELLPNGSKEGSVLLFQEGCFILQPEEEAERRRQMFELQSSLFEQEES